MGHGQRETRSIISASKSRACTSGNGNFKAKVKTELVDKLAFLGRITSPFKVILLVISEDPESEM